MHGAGRGRVAVDQKIAPALGMRREHRGVVLPCLGHHRCYRITIRGERDRGLQQLFEAARAEALHARLPGIHGPGNDRRQNALLGYLYQPAALEFLQGGAPRRTATAVQAVEFASACLVVQQETVTADAGRLRLGDAEHGARRNGGVHGVAAGVQHRQAGLGGHRLAGGDHAVGTHHHGPPRVLIITHRFHLMKFGR